MGTILEDTKKAIGIMPGYDVFDDQILMHINTARMDLAQLGPKCDTPIEKDTAWTVFDDIDDPPGNSFLVSAYQKLIEEAAWRLIYQTEGKQR